MSRSSARRLNDILAAIAAVDRAEAVGPRHAKDGDLPEVVLAAIPFHVFTIGEAVKALPEELTGQRADVPWSDLARMRDLIGHHYYKLDAIIVRATIGDSLDHLRAACGPHARRCSPRTSTQSPTGTDPVGSPARDAMTERDSVCTTVPMTGPRGGSDRYNTPHR